MRHPAPAALLALCLCPPALAGAAAPGQPVQARRATSPIVVDGLLEEPAWDAAVPYDGFVEVFPAEGATPSERTEVRVLYDDRALYVGVRCFDSRPGEVSRPLGRRDNTPYSDVVGLYLDANHDRRTAAFFQLSAAGVQEDALLSADDALTTDWDAVWDGAAAATPDGWTAEFMIPLSILRFSSAPEQVFGFGVRRVLARTHEEILSIPMKRSDRGTVARLADLTGLSGLQPVQELSVAPYLAARPAWRPKYADTDLPARPRPRLLDPMGDVGVDLRSSLGRGLALQATLNPDFGQVEADQITENLSTFELFFPEKRPFFLQGMDLFQGVAPADHASPAQLFYSRRIGLDAPILGAAKLSGRVSDEWQVGALAAVVGGATPPAGSTEDAPVRGYRFSALQPLHFGPADALPTITPAARSFLAAFSRYQPSAAATLGATVTSGLPLGPRCTAGEALLDDTLRPARCDVVVGNAAALDWSLRSADGEWYLRGQATGSQWLGGEPTRTLLDGTRLARGDLGAGAFVAAGRQGGEPWRFDLSYEAESPRLDVNAVGYQRTQNEQMGRSVLRYVRPAGGGPFHSYGLHLFTETRWTTDGRGRNRGNSATLATEFQLRSFDAFGVNLNGASDYDDVRELQQSGVALRRPGYWGYDLWFNTDKGRAVWLELAGGSGAGLTRAPMAGIGFWYLSMTASARPHPRVETRLDATYDDSGWPARYLSDDGAGLFTLASLRAPSISVTLRQQLVLSPRLTLQAYAQLFTASGHYGRYWLARGAPGGEIGYADLSPGTPSVGNDFRESRINLSAVLRWEFRLGSTLFLVYTRSAAESAWPTDVDPPLTLRPQGLGRGPTRDTVLVKWTWFWSR